jgi:hypothetical protein
LEKPIETIGFISAKVCSLPVAAASQRFGLRYFAALLDGHHGLGGTSRPF